MQSDSQQMKELIIIGAGGFGREMLWFIDALNHPVAEWKVLGFVDDTPEKQGSRVEGFPVLGPIESLRDMDKKVYVTCPIGSSKGRKTIAEKLSGLKNIEFASLVSQDATFARNLVVGEGCIVYPGVTITSNVKLGKHCVVNLGATLSHDVELQDFATISPGVTLCGNVMVGAGCELGAATTIIEKIVLAPGVKTGAGAVVVQSIDTPGLYVGVPAKLVRRII